MIDTADESTELSLSEVRTQFFAALSNGALETCPCCDRNAGYYPERLSTGFCRTIEYLAVQADWSHPSKALKHTRYSAALLRHWGLTECKAPVGKARGPESGFWRLTQKGRDFYDGNITVPMSILLYAGRLIEPPHGEEISFEEARTRRIRPAYPVLADAA